MQPSKDDWVPSSNPLNIYCMRNVPNGTESVTDDAASVLKHYLMPEGRHERSLLPKKLKEEL